MVYYKIENKIAYITLNRPEKRNALNNEMVTALITAFENCEFDENVKIVILRAEGKVFCSGADLESLQKLQKNTYEENLGDSILLKELYRLIYIFPKIVIAQVQGSAIAGGCGLASVCDFIFAVEDAKFGYTEVKIGFIPAIVMIFLIRKIGELKTKELLITGNLITAQEAKNIGLINFVFSEVELKNKVNEFAFMLISNNSHQAMSETKKMLVEIQEKTLDEALNYSAKKNALTRQTDDCKKGIDAFLKKKNLQWI